MTVTPSRHWWSRALSVMPGGVNSPLRAFGPVGGDPIVVESAKGAFVVTADGDELVDLVSSWGALILGHAHADVVAAITEAASQGTSVGLLTAGEVELAETIVEIAPTVEQVRLVNSGTEATMSAVRLARSVTGRDLLVVADGSYHGHAESSGVPGSGVPAVVTDLIRRVPFNDVAAAAAALADHRAAAMLVEPVSANMGVIPPLPGYLDGLREACTSTGTLLVFDEVVTGFRVAQGGAQDLYGISADLTCFGKVVGGGTALAAYGGSAEIMSGVAPIGPMYQAGTLSGNPIGVAAGLATLRLLRRNPSIYADLEARGAKLEHSLTDALGGAGVENRVGSMMSIFFTPRPVVDRETARSTDQHVYERLFRAALRRGVLLPPAPLEAWFLTIAHANGLFDAVCDALIEAVHEALQS